MALQFFDGFDDYGSYNTAITSLYLYSALYAQYGGFATTGGAFSGTAIGGNDSGVVGGGYIQLPGPLSSPTNSVIVGARAYYTGATGYTCANVYLDNFGRIMTKVQFTQVNGYTTVSAVNYAGTTLGSSSTFILQPNTWIYFESLVTMGTTNGSVTALINGQTVLTLNNVNTQSTLGNVVYYAGINYGFNGTYTYVDDMYVCDTTGPAPYNTFLTAVAGSMGPRVLTLFPSANESVQWTPKTGTNYSEVNNSTFQGDSSYVYSSVPGNTDLYNVSNVSSATINEVLAVQTTLVSREDNAGTVNVAGLIQSGGNIYQGNTLPLTVNYQKVVNLYTNDPDTGSTWNPSKFFTGNVSIGVRQV